MSPRSTHALHKPGDLDHLAPVLFVGLKGSDLRSQSGALPETTCAVEDRSAYRFRPADAGRFKLRECLQSFRVQADADRRSHTHKCITICPTGGARLQTRTPVPSLRMSICLTVPPRA